MFKLLTITVAILAASTQAAQKISSTSSDYTFLQQEPTQSRKLAYGDKYYWNSYSAKCYNDRTNARDYSLTSKSKCDAKEKSTNSTTGVVGELIGGLVAMCFCSGIVAVIFVFICF